MYMYIGFNEKQANKKPLRNVIHAKWKVDSAL